jgi:hypothetical protein
MTETTSRGLAAQILQETAVAHPDVFGNWIYLRDVRDKILHPFDRERLRLSYKAGNSWDALKDAAKSARWLEVRGENLDMEVRARFIPVETFQTMEEALERIRHLDVVFAHWKEIGHKLLLAEETIWNMREHIKATDTRLMRALALIFHYKVLAQEYHEMLTAANVSPNTLRGIAPPDKETLDKMWQENTAAYGPLKLMLADTGILDDDDKED